METACCLALWRWVRIMVARVAGVGVWCSCWWEVDIYRDCNRFASCSRWWLGAVFFQNSVLLPQFHTIARLKMASKMGSFLQENWFFDKVAWIDVMFFERLLCKNTWLRVSVKCGLVWFSLSVRHHVPAGLIGSFVEVCAFWFTRVSEGKTVIARVIKVLCA